MNATFDREEALFAEALILPAAQRAAFLDQACAGDPVLRQRLGALLTAHDATASVLAPPEFYSVLHPEEQLGSRIDRYLLVEKIGEGGCGTVYLAEQQEPIHRRVALKVIKLGMDSHDVVARFQAERQTLALMDHPNIANVLDAGATCTGRPYFVMELVAGTRLTTFCDEHQLSLTARLQLFVHVCHAIQHAHQKGIIHRDIKPSNILVTEQDGVPVPKVIDFGIAKATHGQINDRSVLTAIAQFVGTPVYMSPEQAEFSGRDIDTRSDIYSLGVLLYELIVGRPPFDPAILLEAGLDEIRRQIRDVEPPRPSTRLSTLTAADRVTIARRRDTEPARLATLLRSDLDWIVMRCLEKDRARRYETANGLAADVERHLNHEPVSASPPSAAYRLQKLVRRHKLYFAAAAAVLFALLAGTVVSTWQAVRAIRAERLAGTRMQSELAARQEAEAHQRMAEQQQKLAEEQRLLAEAQRRLADEHRSLAETRLRSETAARQDSERQKTLAEQERVRAQTAEKVAQAEAQISQAVNGFLQDDLLRQADSRVQANSAAAPNPDLTVREALDRAAGRVGERFNQRPLVEAGIRMAIGQTYMGLGVYDQAAQHFARATQLRTAELGPEHPGTLGAMNSLGSAYGRLQRLPEAAALLEQTLTQSRSTLGAEHADTLNTMNNLAFIYWSQRRSSEAEVLLTPLWKISQRVLGPENPQTLIAAGNLATLYHALGRVAESTALFEETRALQERVLGRDHPDTLLTTNNLGTVYLADGRPTAASELLERVVEVRRRVLSPHHPETLQSMNDLASAYRNQGRLDDSALLLEQTVEVRRQVLNADHPDTLLSVSNLGCTYWAQGREIQATALFQESAEGEKRVLGVDHPDTIQSLSTLAGAYCAQGRFDDAVPLLQETLTARQRLFGQKHRATFLNARDLGAVHLKQRNFAAAEALLLRECYTSLSDSEMRGLLADDRETEELELTALLADLYTDWGHREESLRWRQQHDRLLRGPVILVAAQASADARPEFAATRRTSTSAPRTTLTGSTSTTRRLSPAAAIQPPTQPTTPETTLPPVATTTPEPPPSTTPPSGLPPLITHPGGFRPVPPAGSDGRFVGPGGGPVRHTPMPGGPPSPRPAPLSVSPTRPSGATSHTPTPRSSALSTGSSAGSSSAFGNRTSTGSSTGRPSGGSTSTGSSSTSSSSSSGSSATSRKATSSSSGTTSRPQP